MCEIQLLTAGVMGVLFGEYFSMLQRRVVRTSSGSKCQCWGGKDGCLSPFFRANHKNIHCTLQTDSDLSLPWHQHYDPEVKALRPFLKHKEPLSNGRGVTSHKTSIFFKQHCCKGPKSCKMCLTVRMMILGGLIVQVMNYGEKKIFPRISVDR